MAKNYLTNKGIEFEAINIEETPEARDFVTVSYTHLRAHET